MQHMFAVNVALFLLSTLILGGIASSLVSRRFGAPLLLMFLVVGMLAGEDGPGGIAFSNYRMTYFIGSLALAIILFDGGLRLKKADLKANLWPSMTLATVGVCITTLLVGVVAVVGLHLSWLEGLLIGAILASTDAAAVMLLVKSGGFKLKNRLAHTLEIESGTNDPIAIFMTITLVQALLQVGNGSNDGFGWHMLARLAQESCIGLAAGVVGGYGLSWFLSRLRLSDGLNPLFVLAGSIFIFSTGALLHGSGFLAVYVAGIIVGNRPLRNSSQIINFQDSLTILSQMVMFLALGLLVSPSRLLDFAVPALLIAVTLMFIARPLAVWLCLWPFETYSADEKNFVSWVGLRGAVAIFLAAIPMLSGLPHAAMYFNIAFFVVLISLVTQGWTMPSMARYLKVTS